MIISAIELMSTKDKPYQEFYYWIEKQKPLIKQELENKEVDENTFMDIPVCPAVLSISPEARANITRSNTRATVLRWQRFLSSSCAAYK